jgi:cyclopropane-fatty-acyl-phospholipid synthase
MLNNILIKYIINNINIKKGSLNVYLNNQAKYELNPMDSPQADINIVNNKFYKNIITKGDVGLGESYIKQYIKTSNLTNLLRVLSLNIDNNFLLANSNFFMHKIGFKLINLLRKNSIKQSKKNISFHYDVGNSFYKLWLDNTMTYSSAIFTNKSESLEEAQANKYNRILDILENKLGKNLNILEIGCGFGGFSEFALKRNHKITAITISKEQYDYATKRLNKYIENKNCTLLFEDYRNINQQFDAIVSIEMFEAVGEEYWYGYFDSIYKNLKQSGIAIIQTIFIQDKYFNDYKNTTDFIRHYIFPGGFLPSDINFISSAKKATLNCKDYLCFGLDYAKTLEIWLTNFDSKKDDIIKMGYSEEFIRMWRFYLAYCIAGFESKRIDVAQFELVKE